MKVDFHSNENDIRAAIMGRMGYSSLFIAQKTGLTPSQIGYRLWKKQIKRSDYRNGNDPIVNHLLHSKIADILRTEIKE